MSVQQLGIFDAPVGPLPARSGEHTSRQAARRLNLRDRKRQVMYAAGELHGVSFTADDVRDRLLAAGVGWAVQIGSVRSRMSQLAHDGLLVRSGVAEGRCGSDVTTWRLTAEGREWLG